MWIICYISEVLCFIMPSECRVVSCSFYQSLVVLHTPPSFPSHGVSRLLPTERLTARPFDSLMMDLADCGWMDVMDGWTCLIFTRFAFVLIPVYEDEEDKKSSPFDLPNVEPFTWQWLSTINRVNSQVQKVSRSHPCRDPFSFPLFLPPPP